MGSHDMLIYPHWSRTCVPSRGFWFYDPLKNFSLILRRHHYGEGLQILTSTRQNGHWAVRVVTGRTYLKWPYPKTRVTKLCCRAFSSGVVTTWLTRYVAAGIRTPKLPYAGQRLLPSAPPLRCDICRIAHWQWWRLHMI